MLLDASEASQRAEGGLEGVIAALSEAPADASGSNTTGADATSLAVMMHETVRAQTGGDSERVEALFRDCLTRLKQRRSTADAAFAQPAAHTDGELAARALERLRETKRRRETLGDDMTRLPRPRMP